MAVCRRPSVSFGRGLIDAGRGNEHVVQPVRPALLSLLDAVVEEGAPAGRFALRQSGSSADYPTDPAVLHRLSHRLRILGRFAVGGCSFSGRGSGSAGSVRTGTYFSEDVGWSSTNALRVDLARHCLQLDMEFHHERTPGEMIERVDGDVEALGRFFSQFVIQIVGNLVLLLGILAMLLREDWRAGWLLGLFVAGSLVVLNALRNLAVPYWKESRQKSAEHFGFLEERLAATEDIRSCRAQPYVLNQFYRLTREWFRRDLKAGFMTSITINSNWLLFAVGNAAALAVSAYLFHEGGITIGTAYLIFHYANMLEEPVNRITIQIQEFQRAAAGVERINELLSLKSRLPDSGSVSLSRGPLAVSFQGVTFSYDGGDAVLRDVSLELSPGTVLGLLGRTGSGKSTLARLLVRLHDPRAGCVCLGGCSPRSAWAHFVNG